MEPIFKFLLKKKYKVYEYKEDVNVNIKLDIYKDKFEI